ncbi:MAG: helix-turn-helix transcriptional regulator, partial [Solirubrobacteraceae bacterium]
LEERHADGFEVAGPGKAKTIPAPGGRESDDPEPKGEAAIRPECFARLVTLASILIQAGREGRRLDAAELCERLQISAQELQEDINVLNVVNFGAGSYVLYAELGSDGQIEVDPDAYSDSFARPARLLPVEAKALVAAVDLIGEHIPQGSLTSVREKVVNALGEDPIQEGLQITGGGGDDSEIASVVSRAIAGRRLLSFEYYKENEDEFSLRRVEPYALINGLEGWYVACYDLERESVRHFRLDRVKSAEVSDERFEHRADVDPAAGIDGWPRTGEVPASERSRVWISPERARWAREERTVVQELADGAVVVELSFAGSDWLVREVLKEAGDAAVLEPAEARDQVRAAVARLTETGTAAATA